MDTTKHIFAKKHLTKSVRFCTALKITSKAFIKRYYNAPSILYALMSALEDYKEVETTQKRFTGFMKNAISNVSFSKETENEIVKFFVKVYNDDEMLIAWLNGQVTEKSINRSFIRVDEYSEEQAVDIAKQIVNRDLLEHLDIEI